VQSLYSHLPKSPGVYHFYDKAGKILYIGKAKNLKDRVDAYWQKGSELGEKTRLLISRVRTVSYIKVNSDLEAMLLEAYLIRKHKPFFNVELKDDKRYPLVKISIRDKWPRVSLARKEDKDGALYFGPYPPGFIIKKILTDLRKIFAYRSCKKLPSKPCLYFQLGLCPGCCIEEIKIEKEYKKTIASLAEFLSGDIDEVTNKLRKKREKLSKNLNFEEAGKLEKKIEIIEKLNGKTYAPLDYLKNPNLVSDIRKDELEGLVESLTRGGLAISDLYRIEGYDISEFGRKMVVGSMVVFIKGSEEKSLYRRFKVKRQTADPQSLAQVVGRRLKHKEWSYPNLIVLDGGKGQLSEVAKAVNNDIALIAYEKGGDKVYSYKRVGREVVFFRIRGINKAGFNLLNRIRDESHRFAASYHKKLRKLFFDRELAVLLR